MVERDPAERLEARLSGAAHEDADTGAGAGGDADADIRELLAVAAALRDLPDDGFRNRLRHELERTMTMTMTNTTTGDVERQVARRSGISYLHIPAADPRQSAAFYHGVFGWNLRGDPEHPSFDDGTGHVIGSWVTDLPVAGQAGVLPYIYVDDVDVTLAAVGAHGGEVVRSPYPEGALWVATFRDPAGNVVGVWQQGPRDDAS